MDMPVFASSYLPPVQYISQLKKSDNALIEYFEHFKKQTIRNHCIIYSPNGPLKLSIPLHKRSERTKTKDIMISDGYDWQKLHWRSLEAAYRSSPYFEFYEDSFRPFYEQKFKFLVDLNEKLLSLILKHLKLTLDLKPTLSYESNYTFDYRSSFGEQANESQQLEYIQVFNNRYGFLPNLSIVDLLFNHGPRSHEYL